MTNFNRFAMGPVRVSTNVVDYGQTKEEIQRSQGVGRTPQQVEGQPMPRNVARSSMLLSLGRQPDTQLGTPPADGTVNPFDGPQPHFVVLANLLAKLQGSPDGAGGEGAAPVLNRLEGVIASSIQDPKEQELMRHSIGRFRVLIERLGEHSAWNTTVVTQLQLATRP